MNRYLIVAGFPYINGVKHLGNLAGSMLPADVYARFRRLRGHEVLFVCGTDEHGSTAELAAIAARKDIRTYCDEQHKIQKRLCDGFSLSFDWFGRTSNQPTHWLAQYFCDRLLAQEVIEERVTQQLYSRADRRFLADRFIGGTCPRCAYERARGDQCENCSALLEPTDLKHSYSRLSGSANFEMRETLHLFLMQSKMRERLREWITASINWSPLAKKMASQFLDRDLIDIPITRDLSWGVPVKNNDCIRAGYEDKVFYFWFDAPIGPIGATVEWSEASGQPWERWWRTDQGAADVLHTQFVGKDNVPFLVGLHSSTILGSGEPWKLIDRLKAFHWLTWYGGKFSTGEKRGIFMDQALELLPCDYWRWYLIANSPEGDDAPFTLEHFRYTVNSDLSNVFGNFVLRVLRLCQAKFDGKTPGQGTAEELELDLLRDVQLRCARLTAHLEQIEFRKASAELRALWARGNKYLQTSAPWLIETDKARAAVSVRIALNLVRLFAVLAQPFIPNAASLILDALAVPKNERLWPSASDARLIDMLPHGEDIKPVDTLFEKIPHERIVEWEARFGAPLQSSVPNV